jgi:Flp pilus assembly protein TadD
MRFALLAAGTIAAALAAATVVRVPAGAVAVRSWRGGGTPTLLQPGLALRLPVLQSLDVISGGALDAKGTAEAPSREGTTVGLPYAVVLHLPPQDLLRLSRDGGTAGARGALAGLVEARLKELAAGASTYDLASGAAREILEGRLRETIQQQFAGAAPEVSLGQPTLSAEVRASFEREAIFARRAETGLNVVLVGLDGADWDVIDPMVTRGELPNLARLKREGAWARMRSSIPTLSPLLWTTIATGKSPDRHGINDFLVADPRTGRRVPINSTFRRVRAFWNIVSEAGLPVDVVAWWATWPAEAVQGHMVSDRIAYSTFNLGSVEARSGAVYPPAYASRVDTLRVREADVTWKQVTRFLHVTEPEFRAARAVSAPAARPSEDQESINVFVRVLAATETYRKVALDLLGDPADHPRIFAVYFQGVDEVNHRFAHCAPPRAALCSDGDWRRFQDAVAEFYRYQDAILGEILARAAGATAIVVSDHGFANGRGRPDDVKPFIEGKPGLWHDMTGIFVAAGKGIAPGEVPSVTLYDIAPTLLYLVGLPVPEDMPGRVVEKALAPEFVKAHPVAHVPSYEGLGVTGVAADAGRMAQGTGGSGDPMAGGAEDEMVEQLRSLGYIGGAEGGRQGAGGGAGSAGSAALDSQAAPGTAAPPGTLLPGVPGGSAGAPPGAGIPTLLYHTNLAAVYMARRQFDKAEAELRKALAIQPDAPEALSAFAALYQLKGEPEKALDILRGLVGSDPHYAPSRLTTMADLYVRMGRPADGIAYFRGLQGRGDRRFEAGRLVALGMVQSAAGRAADAEISLRAALEIEPASLEGMQELFALLDARGRAGDLEPLLQAALRREPRVGMFHNWLGLVLKRRGDLHGAEMEFRKGLEVAPDLVGCMANLGGLYLQQGRATEAVAILQSALEKEPRNLEARTNLIVGLGLEHDLAGARAQVDAAEKLGQKAPQFHNALGYALYVNGRPDEALETLRKSLAMDPQQPDARRLMQEIESGAPAPGSAYR